jgi:hypothetical protein
MPILMNQGPSILANLGSQASLAPRLRQALRQMADRRHGRVRRVLLMLMLLCLVNAFDLSFTIIAARTGSFKECNPIAAPLVASQGQLAAFKIFMVLFAASVIVTFRRHWLTELGCWVMTATYVGLAVVWWMYYGLHA